MHILKAEGLKKIIHNRNILKGIDIEVRQGEIVGLLGPNGAGKTTTFMILIGELKTDYGKISFDDSDISKLPMHKRAKLGISYLPQESSVFRGLTVEENILSYLEFNCNSRTEMYKRLDEVLDMFKMTSKRKILAKNLSGGEKRRLEIMRAFSLKPFLMLLDEPFSGVDPITVDNLQKIILQLKAKNIGLLITDHNVHEIFEIADRTYIINDGRVLAEGDPKKIEKNEIVRKIFLGELFHINS